MEIFKRGDFFWVDGPSITVQWLNIEARSNISLLIISDQIPQGSSPLETGLLPISEWSKITTSPKSSSNISCTSLSGTLGTFMAQVTWPHQMAAGLLCVFPFHCFYSGFSLVTKLQSSNKIFHLFIFTNMHRDWEDSGMDYCWPRFGNCCWKKHDNCKMHIFVKVKIIGWSNTGGLEPVSTDKGQVVFEGNFPYLFN